MKKVIETTTENAVHPRDVVNKYLWWFLVFAITIVFALGIKHEAETRKGTNENNSSARIPLASMPRSSWTKLTIPPGERSETFAIPPGMRGVIEGSKFLVHNVYENGSECAANEKCGGSSALAYVTNEDKVNWNVVSVHFVPL